MIKCVFCGQCVTSKRGLAFHIKKHKIDSVDDYLIKFPEEIKNVEPKDENLLTCPICGRYNMKQLGQHITGTHKLTHEEFKKLYPDQIMFIPEISERCRRAEKIGNERYLENVANDPKKYEEIYRKRAIKRRENNPDIGNKIATILREHGVYEQTSIRTKKMWQDAGYIEMQSEKCKKQHLNGLTEKVLENSGKRRYSVEIDGTNYNMRSTWEIKFAKLLHENGIDFKYESIRIQYEYMNKTKIYVPDFVVKNTILFEVKPKSLINAEMNKAKMESCIAQGYSFRYITEDELNDISLIDFTGCY